MYEPLFAKKLPPQRIATQKRLNPSYLTKEEKSKMEHSNHINNVDNPIKKDKDENEYIKSKEIIESHLSELRLFEIGNHIIENNDVFASKYMGGVINPESENEGVITCGACLKKSSKFSYHENDIITMAYTCDGKLYMFSTRIIGVHEATAEDIAKINLLFHDRLENLEKILGPMKFIVIEICVLTEPILHQRRQHPRSKVKWDVYFKFIEPDEELDNAQKIWIENKVFEFDRGYFKTQTVDVSAGGFKSKIKVYIPQGTNIECIMEIKMGKIKAIGRILSKVVGCSPSHSTPGFYNMRVQFMDLSDSLKSAMTNNPLS